MKVSDYRKQILEDKKNEVINLTDSQDLVGRMIYNSSKDIYGVVKSMIRVGNASNDNRLYINVEKVNLESSDEYQNVTEVINTKKRTNWWITVDPEKRKVSKNLAILDENDLTEVDMEATKHMERVALKGFKEHILPFKKID